MRLLPVFFSASLISSSAFALSALVEDQVAQREIQRYSDSDVAAACDSQVSKTFPGDEPPAGDLESCRQSAEAELRQGNTQCEADVHYPRFSGVGGEIALNRAMQKVAAAYRCRMGVASVRLTYRVSYNAGDYISVLFTGSRDAGRDACPDTAYAYTFNSSKGKLMTLKEVIDPSRETDLKNYLAARIAEYPRSGLPSSQDARESARREMLRSFDIIYNNLSFYIDNKSLVVEPGQALYGCNYGVTFPIELPKDFIKDYTLLSQINQ